MGHPSHGFLQAPLSYIRNESHNEMVSSIMNYNLSYDLTNILTDDFGFMFCLLNV